MSSDVARRSARRTSNHANSPGWRSSPSAAAVSAAPTPASAMLAVARLAAVRASPRKNSLKSARSGLFQTDIGRRRDRSVFSVDKDTSLAQSARSLLLRHGPAVLSTRRLAYADARSMG